MTVTLAFFADAGLTQPLARLDVIQADDNSLPAVDRVIYLGSNASGKKFNAASDPGVDAIVVALEDTGTGLLPNVVRLAASAGDLATATPGAALTLAPEILSGPANSVPVHVRVDLPATAIGRYENLSFATNDLIETLA
jgi:hypothetical protein